MATAYGSMVAEAAGVNTPFNLHVSFTQFSRATNLPETAWPWWTWWKVTGEARLPLAKYSALLAQIDGKSASGIGDLRVLLEATCGIGTCPREVSQEASQKLKTLSGNIRTIESSNFLLWSLQEVRRHLGTKPQPVSRLIDPPQTFTNPNDYLDAFGWTQLSKESTPDASHGMCRSLLQNLARPLASNPHGTEMEAAYAANAWTACGGDRQTVLDAFQMFRERIDAKTGLVTQYRALTGDIESTYLIAKIVDPDFKDLADNKTISSLQDRLHEIDLRGNDLVEGLMIGSTLRAAGALDEATGKKIQTAAVEALAKRTMTVDNASSIAQLVSLLEEVGGSPPHLDADLWSAESPEGRRALYAALTIPEAVSNVDALRQKNSTVLGSLSKDLQQDALRGRELERAYSAYVSSSSAVDSTVTQEAQRRVLDSPRCSSLSQVLTEADDRTCSLYLTKRWIYDGLQW